MAAPVKKTISEKDKKIFHEEILAFSNMSMIIDNVFDYVSMYLTVKGLTISDVKERLTKTELGIVSTLVIEELSGNEIIGKEKFDKFGDKLVKANIVKTKASFKTHKHSLDRKGWIEFEDRNMIRVSPRVIRAIMRGKFRFTVSTSLFDNGKTKKKKR